MMSFHKQRIIDLNIDRHTGLNYVIQKSRKNSFFIAILYGCSYLCLLKAKVTLRSLISDDFSGNYYSPGMYLFIQQHFFLNCNWCTLWNKTPQADTIYPIGYAHMVYCSLLLAVILSVQSGFGWCIYPYLLRLFRLCNTTKSEMYI